MFKLDDLKFGKGRFGTKAQPVQPYYYQSENLKTFDLYSSNDKNTWELLGQFDIGFGDNNGDGTGSILSEKIDEATNGHNFVLNAVSAPLDT